MSDRRIAASSQRTLENSALLRPAKIVSAGCCEPYINDDAATKLSGRDLLADSSDHSPIGGGIVDVQGRYRTRVRVLLVVVEHRYVELSSAREPAQHGEPAI